MDVKKGKRYRCIKSVNFGGIFMHIKGKIYKSEVEGCITDETGYQGRLWINASRYFVQASNKRKREWI